MTLATVDARRQSSWVRHAGPSRRQTEVVSDKGLLAGRFVIRAAIGVVIVAEVVLALGIVLQALGANPEAGFAEWSYENQDRLMGPFEGMFDDTTIGDSDGVVDWSGLFAAGAYALLFIPLGMALGAVRRARRRNDERQREAAEAARQARIFGEPEPVAPARRGGRLGGVFSRRSGSAADESSSDADG